MADPRPQPDGTPARPDIARLAAEVASLREQLRASELRLETAIGTPPKAELDFGARAGQAPDAASAYVSPPLLLQRVRGAGQLHGDDLADVAPQPAPPPPRPAASERSLLQAIIENVPAFVFVKDVEGRFLLANRRFAHFFGLEPEALVGRTEDDFFPPKEAVRWRTDDARAIESGHAIQYDDEVTIEGEPRCFFTTKFPIASASGATIGVGAIVTDVTETRRIERERQQFDAQMREVQRYESIGVLAGGIAHDFNNILTSLLGYADLALLDLPAGSPAVNSVVEVISGIQRAAELTGQILAYSGKGAFVISAVDVASLVRDMTSFIRISIPKKIAVRYDEQVAPVISGDATQIRQVVMNLILNAAEAIGEREGRIVISTGLAAPDDPLLAAAAVPAGRPAPAYAFVRVQDDGAGMRPETARHLFEPYYTTKRSGRGLGMSVVLGIVRSHGGAISVETEPGRGTTMTVFLPAEDLAMAVDARPPVEYVVRGEPRRRRVLIVDDEHQVLDVAGRIVERLGYVAVTVSHAEEAVARYRAEPDGFDCVLLDLSMPQMDGLELSRIMRSINPAVRVVLCSGYSEQYATERFANQGLAGFLPKPYRIDELRRTLISAIG